MSLTPEISTYVHAGDSLATLRMRIRDLRHKLDDLDHDLGACDFRSLRRSLLALPDQVDRMRKELAPENRNYDPTEHFAELLAIAPENGMLHAAFSGMEYKDFEAFEESVLGVLEERGEPKLRDSFVKFCEKARKATGADDSGYLDYVCLFAPSTSQFAQTEVALLRQYLDWMLRVVKKAFGPLRRQTDDVWDILRDPDRYYLRLRGEVHELAREQPDQPWLNYLYLLPDLFRLYARLLLDYRVGESIKRWLLTSMTFLVSPLDFLPEGFIGPVGYVDDVFLLAHSLLDFTSSNAISKGLLQEHWSGDTVRLDRMIDLSHEFDQHLEFFSRVHQWYLQGRNQA